MKLTTALFFTILLTGNAVPALSEEDCTYTYSSCDVCTAYEVENCPGTDPDGSQWIVTTVYWCSGGSSQWKTYISGPGLGFPPIEHLPEFPG